MPYRYTLYISGHLNRDHRTMYPTPKPAKFLHIAKPGRFNVGAVRHVLCGRMVNLMQITGEDGATCTRCVAIALTNSATTPVEG